MRGVTVEPLAYVKEDHMESLPGQILEHAGIALVGVGSLACIRTLYVTAYQMGRRDQFFACTISPLDYSLGRQGKRIRDSIQQAVNRKDIRGVIVYASCMEVITLWDFAEEMEKINNPREIPVEILYRGPLVKRKAAPLACLEKIWEKWGSPVTKRKKFPPRGPGDCHSLPPIAPDLEGIASLLQNWDCSVLLLTPGGCKSCLRCSPFWKYEGLIHTRFDDVGISGGKVLQIADQVLDCVPDTKLVCLLGSAIMQSVGMDMDLLAGQLMEKGKDAIYLESNGFEGAPPAMGAALLTLGKHFLTGRTQKRKNLIWLIGYSRLTYPQESWIQDRIRHLEALGYQAEVWKESEDRQEGILPEKVLVVSTEGMPLAHWMKKALGIPFQVDNYLPGELKAKLEELPVDRRILQTARLIGEPVVMKGVGRELERLYPRITCSYGVYAPTARSASFYETYASDTCIISAPEEVEDMDTVDLFVGDPVYVPLVKEKNTNARIVEWVYPMVSSTIFIA